MENEQLVRLVAAEVMRRLNAQPQVIQQQPPEKIVHALAIFTGGTMGLTKSFGELKKLQACGFNFSVVLSSAAEQIIGTARILAELGSDTQIVTAAESYPGNLLKAAELVLVPVLTQNTAAKLASTQADTCCTTLIMQALMMGKPVVAAVNAASPDDGERIRLSMGNAPAGLRQVLRQNLKTIGSYGITLVSAAELEAAGKKAITKTCETVDVKITASPKIKRTVLAAAAIRQAYSKGIKKMTIPSGMIITPLARDVARDCGIEFVKKQ